MSRATSPPHSPRSHPSSVKRCEICFRSFSRREHLVRHKRTHTSERPFQCSFCFANFPRADVKDNHVKRFHSEEGLSKSRLNKANTIPKERSKLACDQCRRGKLKCDDSHPCTGCSKKNIECTVSAASRRPGRPRIQPGIKEPSSGPCVLTAGIHETTAVSDDCEALIACREPNLGTVQVSCADSQPREYRDKISYDSFLADFDSVQHIGSATFLQEGITALTHDAIFPPFTGMLLDGLGTTVEDQVDVNFMDPIWQLPLDASQWVEDLDDTSIGGAYANDTELHQDESTLLENSPMGGAVRMMVNYFNNRAGSFNPGRELTLRMSPTLQPGPQIYDMEVINVLLNIGRSHISSTFSIFAEFEATKDTSFQLCLAMAAVGALFSTVEGSETVAKNLYGHARHLQMESYIQNGFNSFATATNSAKTYLLLEVYGICSGNKRIYEFCEAFHYNTVEAFKACWQCSPHPADDNTRTGLSQLTECLYILDSFRVLLLSRPPCFLSWGRATEKMPTSVLHDNFMTDLEALMTPMASLSRSMATAQNIAIISSWTWMYSPRGQESTRSVQPWKTESVEVGLERWNWARAQDPSDADVPQLLIYHLAYLNLYTNLPLLQRHAHEFLDSSRNDGNVKSLAAIRVWINGSHAPIAHWHAEAMLKLIKDNLAVSLPRQKAISYGRRPPEPPHLPYCIYFATLIIWFYQIREGVQLGPKDAPIETATQLLGELRAPVAKVMSTALYKLRDQEHG